MRTNEERVAAVKKSVREMEGRKSVRKARMAALAALAACVSVILLVGMALPGIISGFPEEVADVPGSAASIFQAGSSLGYIVMGVLSFVLGVCCTILCVRLRKYTDKRKDDPEDSDD